MTASTGSWVARASRPKIKIHAIRGTGTRTGDGRLGRPKDGPGVNWSMKLESVSPNFAEGKSWGLAKSPRGCPTQLEPVLDVLPAELRASSPKSAA